MRPVFDRMFGTSSLQASGYHEGLSSNGRDRWDRYVISKAAKGGETDYDLEVLRNNVGHPEELASSPNYRNIYRDVNYTVTTADR